MKNIVFTRLLILDGSIINYIDRRSAVLGVLEHILHSKTKNPLLYIIITMGHRGPDETFPTGRGQLDA
jgi:hypothetical protein